MATTKIKNKAKKVLETTIPYSQVLKEYVSKRRAITKLEYQLKRFQDTLKFSLGAVLIALMILPFNRIMAVVPLVIFASLAIYHYKKNEELNKDYEQLRYDLDIRGGFNKNGE